MVVNRLCTEPYSLPNAQSYNQSHNFTIFTSISREMAIHSQGAVTAVTVCFNATYVAGRVRIRVGHMGLYWIPANADVTLYVLSNNEIR